MRYREKVEIRSLIIREWCETIGAFIFAGYSFEWHIEYRSADGPGLFPDPADPEKTFRVLTLYVAEALLAKKSPQLESSNQTP